MTITMTRPTAAPTTTRPADTDGCYITVNPNGRLSIMDTPVMPPRPRRWPGAASAAPCTA